MSNSWSSKIILGGSQRVLQPRIVLYASAGVGKSTWGSTLPRPLFLDFDHGVDDLRVDRIPGPDTWADALALVREIAKTPGEYRSLVIDTLDPLEELATDHVLAEGKKKTLADFAFGAGYAAVANEWKLFLAELDTARAAGLLVCLLGHAQVRQVQDPSLGTFDAFTSVLSKKAWQITQRWADVVGFAAWDMALVEKKNDQRAIVTGERKLFLQRGSGYDAKNRFGIVAPIPLSWPALESEIARHRQDAAAIEGRILAVAAGTEFEEKARGFITEAAHNVNALLDIEIALRGKLEEARLAAEA